MMARSYRLALSMLHETNKQTKRHILFQNTPISKEIGVLKSLIC